MEEAIKTQDVKAVVQCMKELISLESNAEISSNEVEREKLSALKNLLTLSITEISRVMTLIAKDEVVKGTKGDTYLTISDAQFIEPRGRHTVALSSEGMLLEGKQTNVFIPWSKVSHCACVPSNASSKKEGEELLAFLLSEPVKYNNKDLKSILWNLSKATNKDISATHPSSSEMITGCEHTVVTKLVQILSEKTIVIPNRELFASLSEKKEKFYLKCYKGIQEGALYPLKNGLIFVKPLLFIPTEDIASLSAGRGGGSGNTRYVDLEIETLDGKTYEFTNIDREELPSIQIYVKGYLEARQKAETLALKNKAKSPGKVEGGIKTEVKDEGEEDQEEGGGGGMEEEGEDEDSDDESDEDFDPDASDDEASGRDSDDSKYSGGEDDESDDENERKAKRDKKNKKSNSNQSSTSKKSSKHENGKNENENKEREKENEDDDEDEDEDENEDDNRNESRIENDENDHKNEEKMNENDEGIEGGIEDPDNDIDFCRFLVMKYGKTSITEFSTNEGDKIQKEYYSRLNPEGISPVKIEKIDGSPVKMEYSPVKLEKIDSSAVKSVRSPNENSSPNKSDNSARKKIKVEEK